MAPVDGIPDFHQWLQQVRDGNAAAAMHLVRQFEPLIRREVRMQLRDRRLQRAFDSLDICQAVWSSFFARAQSGQFELNEPEQLAGLLVAMTRNKFSSAVRRERRQCRDMRRLATSVDREVDINRLPGRQATPSSDVATLESLERVQAMLTDDERQLAELRAAGLAWEEIARRLGGTAQARRMQLSRAVRRVMDRIG